MFVSDNINQGLFLYKTQRLLKNYKSLLTNVAYLVIINKDKQIDLIFNSQKQRCRTHGNI